jgi:hypothetical protein
MENGDLWDLYDLTNSIPERICLCVLIKKQPVPHKTIVWFPNRIEGTVATYNNISYDSLTNLMKDLKTNHPEIAVGSKSNNPSAVRLLRFRTSADKWVNVEDANKARAGGIPGVKGKRAVLPHESVQAPPKKIKKGSASDSNTASGSGSGYPVTTDVAGGSKGVKGAPAKGVSSNGHVGADAIAFLNTFYPTTTNVAVGNKDSGNKDSGSEASGSKASGNKASGNKASDNPATKVQAALDRIAAAARSPATLNMASQIQNAGCVFTLTFNPNTFDEKGANMFIECLHNSKMELAALASVLCAQQTTRVCRILEGHFIAVEGCLDALHYN